MKSASVRAYHPDWNGVLRLSWKDGRTRRPSDQMGGVFRFDDGLLKIDWDDSKSDFFRRAGNGDFFHEHPRAVDIHDLDLLRIGPAIVRPTRVAVSIFDGVREINLRLGTSDIPTFLQVFHDREYDSPSLPRRARAIVDLGANIGCSALFFAQKYPRAKILAVEPEPDNFHSLRGNILGLEDRIIPHWGAAWIADGEINLRLHDENGADLGAWGYQVAEEGADGGSTPCWRIETLYRSCGFDRVDILKIDVEGAELELFSCRPREWLSRTNLIAIETHDRFRPGSDEAVRGALAGDFEELPPCGENLFFRRKAA